MNDFIFGNQNPTKLKQQWIVPPFSILDSKKMEWQDRKRDWIALGLKSEIGRTATTFHTYNPIKSSYYSKSFQTNISVFDPVLAEILYHWFCPTNGKILDPFAGGSVRGIIANYLGYQYTGIDIRKEQIESNQEQARTILAPENQPNWIVGDSSIILGTLQSEFDFIFSCPPYGNLEVYSDLPGDISNKSYSEFLKLYEQIIKQSCNLLKKDCFACFVVGEIRDKTGKYYGFVPDTIRAFQKAGMSYYNEAILLNVCGSTAIRANQNMRNGKIVKVHQNILIFKKESSN